MSKHTPSAPEKLVAEDSLAQIDAAIAKATGEAA